MPIQPDARGWVRGLAAGALLSVFALACGGGSDPPTEIPDGTSSPLPTTETGQAPTTSGPQSTQSPSAPQGTSADDIVLHDVNWSEVEDSLGRPAVRYAAIIENTGAHAVEVRVTLEAFGAAGQSVGESGIQPFTETLGPGSRLPLSMGMGPLDASPASVEAQVTVRQIPDFRRERIGRATFEGRIVGVRFEERRFDTIVSVTVEVESSGMVAPSFGIFPHLAVYGADGKLLDGGRATPGLMGLCPGQRGTFQFNLTASRLPDGLDPTGVEVQIFFPDVEIPSTGEADCG